MKSKKGLYLYIVFILFYILIGIISNIYAGDLFKEEAISYREQGYQAQERGDIDSAISFYQKAAELDLNYAAPRNDLGILFEAKGWLDKAESEYQRAIAIDPNYEEAHTNLALLYERKGELEKAAFHWMRRYRLGKSGDPWTEEARQRLEKLGLVDKTAAGKIKKEEVQKALSAVSVQKPPQTRAKTVQKAPSTAVPVQKPQTKVAPKKKEVKKSKSEWTRIQTSSRKEVKKPEGERRSSLDAELEESLRLAEKRLREQKQKSKEKETRAGEPEIAYSRSTASKPGARTYYEKAHKYYLNGEYSRALDSIRTAKKHYPDDSSLLELEAAVKSKMKEERIEDHYNEGIMHYRQKDYSGARQEFESILNILPE